MERYYLDKLGARWSPEFDAYASGDADLSDVTCVLCGHTGCTGHPLHPDGQERPQLDPSLLARAREIAAKSR